MTTAVEPLEDEQVLHVIQLTPSSQLRARRYVYKDVDRFDLRTFARRKDGSWVPTQRGVSFPADKLPELRVAVEALIEAAVES